MFKTSLTTCKIQIKVQILTKNLILKHLSMYRTIRTILRYDMIHMIHTVSYDSWTLTIRWYDTELFTHDTIRIAYRTILTTMLVCSPCLHTRMINYSEPKKKKKRGLLEENCHRHNLRRLVLIYIVVSIVRYVLYCV